TVCATYSHSTCTSTFHASVISFFCSYFLLLLFLSSFFFFFNDPATTEIYTLSLHDALPISDCAPIVLRRRHVRAVGQDQPGAERSEEHTSELQSPYDLVCRLLLEKKKKKKKKKT